MKTAWSYLILSKLRLFTINIRNLRQIVKNPDEVLYSNLWDLNISGHQQLKCVESTAMKKQKQCDSDL